MAQTELGATKIAAQKRNISVEEYVEITKTKKWCNVGTHWVEKSNFVTDNTRKDKLSYKCKSCTHSKNPYATLKGRISTFKGKKHTAEAIKRMSERNKGKPSPMKGKKHSIIAREKISITKRKNSKKGQLCHSYKDGKLVERRGLRFSSKYKRWRFDVFMRDNFTCQLCNDSSGGNLNAHHIKSFSDFPEERFEIQNGITLCDECHKKVHSKKRS
jgi:5-methylcytosine-specific restriction endonuclease McrA